MKILVRFIVAVLIFVLAAASVANIHARAVQLHADGGWQTWAISSGMAVTFALFAYLLIAYKKAFFGFAAAFGAILTSVMQTGMYLALGADWITSLGFGCGGPVLEALLAMAEHYMDEPTKKAGGQSQLWSRIGNAVVSRIEKPAQPGIATSGATGIATVAEVSPVAQPLQNVAQRRDELLRILGDMELPEEINKAALGKQLGVSRTQVDKDIQSLIKSGRLTLNGVVTVQS